MNTSNVSCLFTTGSSIVSMTEVTCSSVHTSIVSMIGEKKKMKISSVSCVFTKGSSIVSMIDVTCSWVHTSIVSMIGDKNI